MKKHQRVQPLLGNYESATSLPLKHLLRYRHLTLGLASLCLVVIAGCQGEPAPEIPVILKDPVVVDSGVYGAGQEKILDYS